MSLTVFPTVLFDSGLGSDTTASGAGNVAASGSAAAVTSGSTSATITDAGVDLTGLNQDGSAALWVNTASGRKFSRISSFTGSVGNWTLTLEDSVWTTGTGLTWGIGGTRATWDNTNSRKLFTADVKGGWTIQTNTNQTLSSAIVLANSVGDTTNGPVTIQGNADSGSQPIIAQTVNASCFQMGGASRLVFRKLAFQNNNPTKTNANGILSNSSTTALIDNCIFGDAVNSLNVGFAIANGATTFCMQDSEIKNCASHGLYSSAGASMVLEVKNTKIHNNGGSGIFITNGTGSIIIRNGNLIYSNANDGIGFTTGVAAFLEIDGNTIHGNGGDGVDLGSAVHPFLALSNNNITANGGWGVNGSNAVVDKLKTLVDYNCFGSSSDSTANTSGTYAILTAGAHDQINVSPGYAAAAAGNFAPVGGSAVLGKGYPNSTRTIGGNTGGTTTFETIGAAQLAQTGGGSGVVPAPLVSIGPQYLDT